MLIGLDALRLERTVLYLPQPVLSLEGCHYYYSYIIEQLVPIIYSVECPLNIIASNSQPSWFLVRNKIPHLH